MGHIRPETIEDVAKRASKAERDSWMALQPRPKLVAIMTRNTYGSPPSGGVLANARSPDDMRQAAAELLELAAWFEKRPKED